MSIDSVTTIRTSDNCTQRELPLQLLTGHSKMPCSAHVRKIERCLSLVYVSPILFVWLFSNLLGRKRPKYRKIMKWTNEWTKISLFRTKFIRTKQITAVKLARRTKKLFVKAARHGDFQSHRFLCAVSTFNLKYSARLWKPICIKTK